MNQRSVDIVVVVVATGVAAVIALLVPPGIVLLRALTLPLVIVLPGYALISAWFPKHPPDVAERVLLSVGLSLVVVILGGLALNWSPFGLSANTWAALLSVITLGASAVALVRRREPGPVTLTLRQRLQLGLADLAADLAQAAIALLALAAMFAALVRRRRHTVSALRGLKIRPVGLTPRQRVQLGLVGLAVVVVSGAIAVSITGAVQQRHPGFTQLWMLPAGTTDGERVVRLGVSSMQSTFTEYRLAVTADGVMVSDWPTIPLQPHTNWEASLVLPPSGSSAVTRVEADLYLDEAPDTIYRHVVLWLGA